MIEFFGNLILRPINFVVIAFSPNLSTETFFKVIEELFWYRGKKKLDKTPKKGSLFPRPSLNVNPRLKILLPLSQKQRISEKGLGPNPVKKHSFR